MPFQVGIVDHDDYSEHRTGEHPESADRLVSIRNGLDRMGLSNRMAKIEPHPARKDDLLRVHEPKMIETVERACRELYQALSADTHICSDSYRVALLAVGGGLAAVDAVLAGKTDRAFCLVRPPGHHATRAVSMGFCLFNNVAAAAAYLIEVHGVKRVLIVDFDLHHGNGTQDIFYDTSEVLYFSTHQANHYPYTSGHPRETGRGNGEGYNLNIPFPAGTPAEEHVARLEEALTQAASEYRPEFVLVSAGFDAHRDDPLGDLMLRSEDYRTITDTICEVTQKTGAKGPVSFLEGGYNLRALAASAGYHVMGLLGTGLGQG